MPMEDLMAGSSWNMIHMAASRRFHLSHPLSSSFRVHPTARYSIQLSGTRVVFIHTDPKIGLACCLGDNNGPSLAMSSYMSQDDPPCWIAVMLEPGDALYVSSASASFLFL